MFSVFKSALHYECSLQAPHEQHGGEIQQQQPLQGSCFIGNVYFSDEAHWSCICFRTCFLHYLNVLRENQKWAKYLAGQISDANIVLCRKSGRCQISGFCWDGYPAKLSIRCKAIPAKLSSFLKAL